MSTKQKYDLLRLRAIACETHRPSTASFKERAKPFLLSDKGLQLVIDRLWPDHDLHDNNYFKVVLFNQLKKWTKHFMIAEGKLVVSYQAQKFLLNRMQGAIEQALQQRKNREEWTCARDNAMSLLQQRMQFIKEAELAHFA